MRCTINNCIIIPVKSEGINVRGYFVWAMLDNFIWAQG
ncbi:MAG: family 1 glycosylhydrolase [Ferruginibacter sp.]|nr:family 1 glycosylhydrolase [Ferruginibacter sp.]